MRHLAVSPNCRRCRRDVAVEERGVKVGRRPRVVGKELDRFVEVVQVGRRPVPVGESKI